jgi:uncharacterized protein (TIGR02145 family)
MRIYFILFCVVASMGLQAQIQQNINNPSGTVSNAISEIDSIRFNTASQEMVVVLEGGQTENHTLGDIDNITFSTAQNSLAHSCGADSVHNPALTYGSMTDQEGNVYKTILIGNQEWMAENLNTGIYRNGEAIPNVTNNTQWATLTTGAWGIYNNDSQYECPYGKLYNWYAVNDSRNVCPAGWHVPSDAEWSTLSQTLDPSSIANITGTQSMVAGGFLKSTNAVLWANPNQDASNSSGFSALPAGQRDSNGSIGSNGNLTGFWTKQAFGNAAAWTREIYYYGGSLERYSYDKRVGYSVRCLRD